jgi:formylglycine-generating enzyme required for sulfatase activity
MLYPFVICFVLTVVSPLLAQENIRQSLAISAVTIGIQVHWENDTSGTLIIGQMEVKLDKAYPIFIELPIHQQKILIFYKGNYYKPANSFKLHERVAHITLLIRDNKLEIKSESEEEYAQRQQVNSQIRLLTQQEIIDKIAAQMVFVQGGSFSMGCNKEQEGPCYDDELPRRTVFVNNFLISRYEVSVQEWLSVMGSLPEQDNTCSQCPVENISWMEAMDFISKLNKLSGQQYRLPTEAEWEFAARGGKQSRGYRYSGSNHLQLTGWHNQNSNGKKQSVGQLSPNELGLYDMSGNVWEWCADWASDNYRGMDTDNPKGADTGEYRIIRGGSWYNDERKCTVFYRGRYPQDGRGNNCGLRIVSDAAKK